MALRCVPALLTGLVLITAACSTNGSETSAASGDNPFFA